MEKKILITPRGYANHGLEYAKEFHSKGYTTDINQTGQQIPRDTFLNLAKDATGIIVGVELIDEELMKQSPNLKAVVKFGVGTDNIDLVAAEKYGIKVGRCVGSNSNAVAETAITLMLMSAKHILPSAITVRNGGWVKPSGFELAGKRVGIIGFGSIGQLVASKAKALGMEVSAFDAFPIADDVAKTYDATIATKEEIYRTCDFITLHIPLTTDSKDMISDAEFDMMKPTACLINTARGGIVNEEALYRALKNKKIYAAAFDVFTTEPPSGDAWVHELVHMDNFILLSHIAARTQEAETNTVKIATQKMLELLNEE